MHFVARGSQLEALRRDGLRVESPEGDFVLSEVAATIEPSEIGPVELVIVTVKAWQVPEVAEAIRPLIGEQTAVLPLQNGVEAAQQLGEVLGLSHILGGLAKIISMVVTPGYIRHVA